MKRIAMSLLLLAMVAWMAGPVFAGDGDVPTPRSLRITISPFSGAVGSRISVSGTGADPAQPVVVTLSPQPATAEGALVTVEVNPSPSGTFDASLTVPEGTADGRFYVRGEQFSASGEGLQYYYNEFAIGAVGASTYLPETGKVPGTPLSVTAALALLLITGMTLRGAYELTVRSINRPAALPQRLGRSSGPDVSQ
jgi:hypothetical protein